MIPSGCRVHLPVTSPTASAFPKSSPWVGFPNRSAKRLRAAGFSRPSPFLTFRPPGLLATQVSPTAAPQRPQGSRDFSTRANHTSLPMHASGMLAVRIRQLTAVGLSPPKTCSLVGRYPGFEPATLRLTATHGASSSPSLGTETCGHVAAGAIVARTRRGKLRPTLAMARSCPFNSMAPVLAIAELVADIVVDDDRDPVGETHTPIATGPRLVSLMRGAPAWPPHVRQG